MKWFFDLRIATKLILSFGAVLVLTAALGVSAIFSMARINEASTDLSANWMPSVLAAMSMRSDVSDLRRWELAHMLAAADSDMALNETRMTETQAKLKTDGDKYRTLISEPGEKELFERFLVLNDEFMRLHATMLSLSREMKKEEARALAVGPSAKVMADMMVALDKLVAINTDGGVRSSASADATYAGSRASLIGLLVGIVAVGMLLALWVARSVSRPLIEAVGVARQVAAGDLTAQVVVKSQDETGQLMQALKEMNASLQSLVGQVRSGTDTIATVSSQIAAGNQDLSSRTEEQASSLEETASSMEELTSTVKQNADNARQANTMALTSSSIAIEGGKVVSEVVGTMASINASSRKIVDIIAVIDGIAFQTNILALNAAVRVNRHQFIQDHHHVRHDLGRRSHGQRARLFLLHLARQAQHGCVQAHEFIVERQEALEGFLLARFGNQATVVVPIGLQLGLRFRHARFVQRHIGILRGQHVRQFPAAEIADIAAHVHGGQHAGHPVGRQVGRRVIDARHGKDGRHAQRRRQQQHGAKRQDQLGGNFQIIEPFHALHPY